MNNKTLGLCLTFFVTLATAGAQEELSSESYLPFGTYPAVSVFGGVAQGPSYSAAEEISAWSAEHAANGNLADVGTMTVGGIALGLYPTDEVSVQLRLSHAFAPRRGTTLTYDSSQLPNTPGYAGGTIYEELSYSFHNLDLKTGLKWVPFAAGPASPYVMAATGVNSTVIRVEDHISDPWLNKKEGGLFLANAVRQHFSFDWMVAAGAEARIGPAFLIFAEYVYDRPFTNHFVEGYKYDTRTDAVVVGTGWRFL